MHQLWQFIRYSILANNCHWKHRLHLVRPGPVRQPRGPKVLPVRRGQLPAHRPIQLGARAILHQQNHERRLLRRHIRRDKHQILGNANVSRRGTGALRIPLVDQLLVQRLPCVHRKQLHRPSNRAAVCVHDEHGANDGRHASNHCDVPPNPSHDPEQMPRMPRGHLHVNHWSDSVHRLRGWNFQYYHRSNRSVRSVLYRIIRQHNGTHSMHKMPARHLRRQGQRGFSVRPMPSRRVQHSTRHYLLRGMHSRHIHVHHIPNHLPVLRHRHLRQRNQPHSLHPLPLRHLRAPHRRDRLRPLPQRHRQLPRLERVRQLRLMRLVNAVQGPPCPRTPSTTAWTGARGGARQGFRRLYKCQTLYCIMRAQAVISTCVLLWCLGPVVAINTCPSGSYSTESSPTCTQCPAGSYNQLSGVYFPLEIVTSYRYLYVYSNGYGPIYKRVGTSIHLFPDSNGCWKCLNDHYDQYSNCLKLINSNGLQLV